MAAQPGCLQAQVLPKLCTSMTHPTSGPHLHPSFYHTATDKPFPAICTNGSYCADGNTCKKARPLLRLLPAPSRRQRCRPRPKLCFHVDHPQAHACAALVLWRAACVVVAWQPRLCYLPAAHNWTNAEPR